MKKYFLKFLFLSITLIAIASCTQTEKESNVKAPKYVFLFIGDGMGQTHVSLTEAYLATKSGTIGNHQFSFTKFPVTGLVSTYSANSYITCSSASGTAISTGYKTNNLMLGVDPDGNNLKSITYKLQDNGYKIGVLTSVSIDHATPGAFYANSDARSNYYEIATQLPGTGFDFFGGGGFINPEGKENDKPNVLNLIEEAGYKIFKGVNQITDIATGDKVVLIQEDDKGSDLPYAIDREENDLTLKDIVTAAIKHLDNDKGFFIMAEGGKIDWAAHSNDAKTTILEVLDLGDAVDVAYQFYLQHPEETLILVTADHETGGLTIGKVKGYELKLNELDNQTKSVDKDKDNKKVYQAMNDNAFVGWTTTSHTGGTVPIYAIGAGAENFSGRMDNTDISRKIFKILNLEF